MILLVTSLISLSKKKQIQERENKIYDPLKMINISPHIISFFYLYLFVSLTKTS